ncbi:hypothetical protein QEH42_gp263 [Microbacterium phage Pumpernickel]|uniref:Uncharacterized protein n=1 Tax=Microbacterium phage Pumpernickel TaxID=2885983 RepID=A0AAE8Y7J7_9CAUD|nr:hypothetical protein QEH42_gp263 [Microbacterium phage Pumpernickel]UDL15955.1 hypothetical protein SEA_PUMPERNICKEL_205 [Microbacterium phage Pumpernickel]
MEHLNESYTAADPMRRAYELYWEMMTRGLSERPAPFEKYEKDLTRY